LEMTVNKRRRCLKDEFMPQRIANHQEWVGVGGLGGTINKTFSQGKRDQRQVFVSRPTVSLKRAERPPRAVQWRRRSADKRSMTEGQKRASR